MKKPSKSTSNADKAVYKLNKHSHEVNKGGFCNNSEIDTLISKRLSVENKAKLSQLEIVNKQCCGEDVLSF